MSDGDVISLWDKASRLPNEKRKVELLEQAVRESDAIGWEAGSYNSRMRLMQAAELSGHGDRVLVAFSWCLAKSEEKPELYPDVGLLWNYKWAIYNSFLFSQVERQRLTALLEDYQQRLLRNGYSQRPAVYLRMQYLAQTGLVAEAAAILDDWLRLPRDRFADCAACELDNQVELYCCLEDDTAARAAAAPILAGDMSCAEIPHRTYARLVASGLRSGASETADWFRKGYEICQGKLDFLGPLGLLGLQLAREENMSRSLSYLKRHLPIAAAARNPRELLDFYAGATAVARSLGNVPVRLYLPANQTLAKTLDIDDATGSHVANLLEQEALKLAAEFDQRNGNAWVSDSWQKHLSLGS